MFIDCFYCSLEFGLAEQVLISDLLLLAIMYSEMGGNAMLGALRYLLSLVGYASNAWRFSFERGKLKRIFEVAFATF